MAISDKFMHASSGTRAEPTTLTAVKSTGATTLTADDLTGWATDTPTPFVLFQIDTSGVEIPGTRLDGVGIVVGNTITQITITAGTDDNYPAGSALIAAATAEWGDRIVDGILNHADQDGTLKAGAVDNAAVLANDVVTTAKILNANVTTAKIANAAVTADKLGTGAQSATVLTNQSTVLQVYSNLTTAGPSVTVTIGANGLALVNISAYMQGSALNTGVFTGIAVSGANTISPNDDRCIEYLSHGANTFTQIGASFLYTGLTPGSTTFSLSYRVDSNTGTWANRRIGVVPL